MNSAHLSFFGWILDAFSDYILVCGEFGVLSVARNVVVSLFKAFVEAQITLQKLLC